MPHHVSNQLPSSLRQPHSSPSVSDLPVHVPATSSYSLNSPLSPSINPSLSFTPGSRPTFSSNLSHHRLPSILRTDSTALWLDRFFWASRFLFSVSSFVFFVWSVRQIKLAIGYLFGARKYPPSFIIVCLFSLTTSFYYIALQWATNRRLQSKFLHNTVTLTVSTIFWADHAGLYQRQFLGICMSK